MCDPKIENRCSHAQDVSVQTAPSHCSIYRLIGKYFFLLYSGAALSYNGNGILKSKKNEIRINLHEKSDSDQHTSGGNDSVRSLRR